MASILDAARELGIRDAQPINSRLTPNKRLIRARLAADWRLVAAWARRDPNSPLVFHRNGIAIRRWRTAWRTAWQAAGVPTRLLHECRRTAARNPPAPDIRRHATWPQSWIQRENWEFETHSRDNQLLQRPPPPVNPDADVKRRERLGGLLSFYYREAARGGG